MVSDKRERERERERERGWECNECNYCLFNHKIKFKILYTVLSVVVVVVVVTAKLCLPWEKLPIEATSAGMTILGRREVI